MIATDLLSRPFAHRGLHDSGVPENSLSAFDAAVRRGLGIELDVRLSRDDVPVVFHDSSLRRMCGIDARLAESPAARLTRLRLGDSADTIPTLASALHTIAGRTPLLVDLKPVLGQRRALVDAVSILLRCYRGPVAVVGFDPWILAGVRECAPRVPRGQNVGVDPRLSLGVSTPHFASYDVTRLPHVTLPRVRSRMPVLAWTVRTESSYRLARFFADGVIVEDAAVDLAVAA